MAASVLATGVVGYLLWWQTRPVDEAALAWADYRRGCETVRSFVHGKSNMGKWRAHMPAVCVAIPDKPTWSPEDVEQLVAYTRLPSEAGETPGDEWGRASIKLIAGDALVSRFVTQQGMTESAAKKIREFMLEELRTGDKVQRGYIANQFMLLHRHYTDPEVRTAVLKTAHDPDEFTAHTVRLNLGYTRDWVKRAVAAQKPGIDPAWVNDKEIEALAK